MNDRLPSPEPETDAAAVARRARAALPAVYVAAAAVGMALGGLSPLIALVLEQRGVEAWVAGLNAGTISVAVIATTPFVPRLARRIGTAETAFLGTAIAAVSIALFPVFTSISAWFALRALTGIGLAFGWVITETWINLVAEQRSRTRVMAIYTTSLAVGFTAGPLAIHAAGTEGAAAFLLVAGAFALAGAALGAVRGRAPKIEQPPVESALRTLLRAPTIVAATVLAGLLDISVFTLLPVWGVRTGLAEGEAVTLVTLFVVGGIATQLPIGWLADRIGQRPVIAAAAVVCVAAPLGLIAASDPGPVAWALVVAWGTAAWALYTVALAMIGDRFTGGAVALANAAFVAVFETANVVGPPAGGWALELWEPHGAMLWFAGTAALALLYVLWRGRPGRGS
jgi:MFS family permease